MPRSPSASSDGPEAVSLWAIHVVLAFLRFDSRGLQELSEGADQAGSLGRALKLSAIPVALLSIALFAISPANNTLGFIGVTSAQVALVLCLSGIPILIALRFALGSWLPFHSANLALLAQSCALLCILVFGAVALASEPAGTDFYLLRNGQGEQTAIYKIVCGDLELSAQTLVLSKRTMVRSRQVLADIEAVASLGQPSMEKVPQALALLEEGLVRRNAEMKEARADLNAQIALLQRSYADAREARNTYSYLEVWLTPLLVLMAAGTVLLHAHIYKIARTRRSQWTSLVTATGALLLSLAAYMAVLWIFVPPVLKLPEMEITDFTSPEQARAAVGGMDRTVQSAINQLRRAYAQRAGYCPNVSHYGLW